MTKQKTDSVILSKLSASKARASFLSNAGDLFVATHKRVGSLEKHAYRLSAAPQQAVFLILSHFNPTHRSKATWASTPLLVVEFDDGSRPTNDAEIFDRASYDAARSASLIGAMIDNHNTPVQPNLVVYSGGKSFHCVFFLHPWIESAADLEMLKRSAAIFRKRSAAIPDEDRWVCHDAAMAFDLSVFATATAIARLPSEYTERFAPSHQTRSFQPCWATQNTAPVSSRELIEMAKLRCTEEDLESARPRPSFRRPSGHALGRRGFKENCFSVEEIESIVGSVQVASDGVRFRVKCPIHSDRTPSAFTTSKGFIYCSVCCADGGSWIARIMRTTSGALEVICNEK